jgi:hypothetical protein|tara:strand:+ start:448 stop:651 length:204 start_codon:yes stop_codon:yes gene_type:complete
MRVLERVVYNCIEYAENKDLGMFIFNNQKGSGWVHNLSNHKIYSVGDFVDWIMHEKMKDKLIEQVEA